MEFQIRFDDARLTTSVRLSAAIDFPKLFELGLTVLERMELGGEPVQLGRINTPSVAPFQRWMRGVEAMFPVEVETPFEGSEFIGGGAWRGETVFPGQEDHALAKLCFAAGAVDLPMHAHEQSDRFIMVLEGEGRYHHAPGTVGQFTGEGVRSVPVREGDVVAFRRDVVHTFSTPRRAMTLLSWHRPYFAFLDPRQYRLPAVRVCPDDPLSD